MPKLLQINSVANIGSTGHIAEQIGAKALAMGWESAMAYGRSARKSASELIRIGNRKSVLRHYLASRLLDRHGLSSKKATEKFISYIDSCQPDVVQIHNLHGYYIHYPLLLDYLKRNGIPTVITLHDFWLATGHCAYINDSCGNWKCDCGGCPRLDSYPKSLCDRTRENLHLKASLLNDWPGLTLVPVSSWLNKILDVSVLAKVNRTVIPNGIDTTRYYPDNGQSPMMDNRYFNILCVATRWTDANGFNDILYLSRLIDKQTRIVMVGVDDRQTKELPANVTGIRRTENQAELRRLYSNANLFLNPNKEVTFGLVTAEAMACGTPCAVYKDTAGEELVGPDGFVIGHIEETVDVIARLKSIQKPDYKAVCRIHDSFDVENTLNRYLQLYNSLI